MCVCLSALTVSVLADRIQASLVFGWHPSIEACSAESGLHCLSVLKHSKHPSPVASLAPKEHKRILTLKDKLCYARSSSDRLFFGPTGKIISSVLLQLGLDKVRVHACSQSEWAGGIFSVL